MKTYKGKITHLNDNQIFVFGSNPLGINGNPNTGKGGAALFALNNGWIKQGEKMNNCLSSSGKAYGLVTVSKPGQKKSKTLSEIIENINKLYEFAHENINLEFLIAYTGISNYNLNGYTNRQLAHCFASIPDRPHNIIFEEEFSTLINNKINGDRGFCI